jgi:hypothetical protein
MYCTQLAMFCWVWDLVLHVLKYYIYESFILILSSHLCVDLSSGLSLLGCLPRRAASGVHKFSGGVGRTTSRLRILGGRRVTRSKYHADGLQILGAMARNLVLALHVGVHLVVVDFIRILGELHISLSTSSCNFILPLVIRPFLNENLQLWVYA